MHSKAFLAATVLSLSAVGSAEIAARQTDVDLGISPSETSAIESLATDPAGLSSLGAELSTNTALQTLIESEINVFALDIPTSVLSAIPTSLINAIENPTVLASVFSEYQSDYAIGTAPSWFSLLPTAAQSDLNSLYGEIAGPEPTAKSASSSSSAPASSSSSTPSTTSPSSPSTTSTTVATSSSKSSSSDRTKPSRFTVASVAGVVGILALAIAL
ncbi:MAG: hypothetical protein M1838_000499 [Thelocarpon superellum]|nr:MAG: hypothetical protein M1838_000499 [Thelocarpon superellum]